jgi:hypothetical protein
MSARSRSSGPGPELALLRVGVLGLRLLLLLARRRPRRPAPWPSRRPACAWSDLPRRCLVHGLELVDLRLVLVQRLLDRGEPGGGGCERGNCDTLATVLGRRGRRLRLLRRRVLLGLGRCGLLPPRAALSGRLRGRWPGSGTEGWAAGGGRRRTSPWSSMARRRRARSRPRPPRAASAGPSRRASSPARPSRPCRRPPRRRGPPCPRRAARRAP